MALGGHLLAGIPHFVGVSLPPRPWDRLGMPPIQPVQLRMPAGLRWAVPCSETGSSRLTQAYHARYLTVTCPRFDDLERMVFTPSRVDGCRLLTDPPHLAPSTSLLGLWGASSTASARAWAADDRWGIQRLGLACRRGRHRPFIRAAVKPTQTGIPGDSPLRTPWTCA